MSTREMPSVAEMADTIRRWEALHAAAVLVEHHLPSYVVPDLEAALARMWSWYAPAVEEMLALEGLLVAEPEHPEPSITPERPLT